MAKIKAMVTVERNLKCIENGFVFENYDGIFYNTDLFISDRGNYYHTELIIISEKEYTMKEKNNIEKAGHVIFPVEAQTSIEK
jgi:hypothetical protein